jgi:hypothetical protein
MATHAHRSSHWRGGAGALVMAAALCGGCSLLLHADAAQCVASTDCAARGAAFAGYTCSQGTCRAPIATADGGGDGGAEAGCLSNKDCTADPTHPEVACDVDTNTCLQLTSDDCPFIAGDYSGADHVPPLAPPIFLGAFAVFPTTGGPLTHPSYLNYNLALSEFASQTAGIPAGPGTGHRTPVAVLCDVAGNVDNAMTHLISDIHVPSIVAALPSATLARVFTTYAASTASDIFLINPFGVDSNLTSLTANNLLWHMLGAPGDNAPAYAAFMPLVESYIRHNPPWNLPAGTPLRVATVTAQSTVTNDLAAAVEDVLVWNGGETIQQNENGASSCDPASNYCAIGISDSTLNGTSLNDTNLGASITAAYKALLAYEPNVIISFASEELSRVVENLEIEWPGTVPRPFYLLGPYNEGSSLLLGDLNSGSTFPPNTVKRFAGIGVASTTDPQVLDDYERRFVTSTGRPDALGQENYYDAMYFAVYSLIAAGRIPDVTGSDIGVGMKHLISLTGQNVYEVGPADMGNMYSAVGVSGGTVELIGTLGPPDFDTRTGARVGQGDVYCYQSQSDAGGAPYAYDYDVLTLVDGGAPADGGSGLQGTFPCYTGIQ